MATDTILVLITLATAIVGTVLNPKHWIKVLIIVLACAAAAATLVKAYEDNSDKDFMKAALAAQLATSRPTPSFQHVLQQSLVRVAQKHGLEQDGSVAKDQGTLYFFSKAHSDARVAAIGLSADETGDAFVKYVSKRPLDPVIESAMFKVPDLKDEDEVAEVLDDLAFVGGRRD